MKHPTLHCLLHPFLNILNLKLSFLSTRAEIANYLIVTVVRGEGMVSLRSKGPFKGMKGPYDFFLVASFPFSPVKIRIMDYDPT